MPIEDGGSVTRWIGDLKAGDGAAAAALWERYFDRLVRLARKRLASRAGGVEDEEDAALSAFESFCAGLARGRFTELGDRDDLWKLLVVITARKAAAQVDRGRARSEEGAGIAWTRPTPVPEAGRTRASACLPSWWPRSRLPSLPPWSPRRLEICSAAWKTASSARSPSIAWKATPPRRSPSGWGAPGGRSPAAST